MILKTRVQLKCLGSVSALCQAGTDMHFAFSRLSQAHT